MKPADILRGVLFAMVTILFLSACGRDVATLRGSGKVIRDNRPVEPFTEIEVGSGIEVRIQQGATAAVAVIADDNIARHVVTEVDGKVLKISFANFSFVSGTEIRVDVTATDLQKIRSGSGASVRTDGVLNQPRIHLEASGGSTIDAEIETEFLSAETNAGSTIELGGKALRSTFSSAGGSTIEAGDLLSNEIETDASSGSSITVQPVLSLTAEASSGSSIYYTRIPKNELSQKEHSGGTISKQ